MSYPIKPAVTVIDGKLAVFMGSDYKLLERSIAKTFVRDVQSNYARLLREERRATRAAKTNQKGYRDDRRG
ncbi:MAG: hypothetical protein WA777_20045 [Rhodanobacter sp.]